MAKGLLAFWVAVAATCGSTTSTRDSSSPVEPDPPARKDAGPDPVLKPQGPPMDATVPLLGGASLQLAELRGRVVLLELSATDRPQWQGAQELYRQLLETLGEDRLVVVSVASDSDATELRRYWDRGKPPFVLGWDPQGALALRLGVTTLPTAFVLNSRGQPLATISGHDAEFGRRVERTVRAAVEQSGGTTAFRARGSALWLARTLGTRRAPL